MRTFWQIKIYRGKFMAYTSFVVFIGLALGGLGLLLALWHHQPIARYAVAGLILNAVPLLLAAILLVLRSAG